jgi:hypothetical protein
MKDNSIGEESRRSRPDYNHPGTLRLSDRYTNSCGQRDLVENDNLAMRAPVLQRDLVEHDNPAMRAPVLQRDLVELRHFPWNRMVFRRETRSIERLSSYLSIHIKNVQNGVHM